MFSADELTIPLVWAKLVSRPRSRTVTQFFSIWTIRSARNDRNTRLTCTTVRPR